jgi:hypothetical protein
MISSKAFTDNRPMLSYRFFPFRGAAMIPFDGAFAQSIVYPLAFGAYDAEEPPPGYT